MLSSILIIPYVFLPLIAWLLHVYRLKSRFLVAVFLVTFGVGSLLYIGMVHVVGLELKAAVDRYDLDSDHSFSDAEMTVEAKEAIRQFTTDTGRTLAFIVAAPVTFIWVSINFLVCAIFRRLYITIRKRRNGRITSRCNRQKAEGTA